MKRSLLAVSCVFLGLSACHVPLSHPSLAGREKLHTILELSIDGKSYSIDYTDSRYSAGLKYESDELCDFEVDHSFTLDFGVNLTRFVVRLPYPFQAGETYTRDDYPSSEGGNEASWNHLVLATVNGEPWKVSAPDFENDSELSVTVDGENDEYVWGNFVGTCVNLNRTDTFSFSGRFSTRKSWVD